VQATDIVALSVDELSLAEQHHHCAGDQSVLESSQERPHAIQERNCLQHRRVDPPQHFLLERHGQLAQQLLDGRAAMRRPPEVEEHVDAVVDGERRVLVS